MRHGKKIIALSAAALASAALAVGTGSAASASSHAPVNFGGSTQACTSGIYAGYCGTQVSDNGNGLSIAVGFGGQIIGTLYPFAQDAEWFWFADGTSTNNSKYAEFAPDGIASNKVMADVNHHIVLANASGNADQKWYYNGTGWTNVGTNDVLKATTNGGPILAVHTQHSSGDESWAFVTP